MTAVKADELQDWILKMLERIGRCAAPSSLPAFLHELSDKTPLAERADKSLAERILGLRLAPTGYSSDFLGAVELLRLYLEARPELRVGQAVCQIEAEYWRSGHPNNQDFAGLIRWIDGGAPPPGLVDDFRRAAESPLEEALLSDDWNKRYATRPWMVNADQLLETVRGGYAVLMPNPDDKPEKIWRLARGWLQDKDEPLRELLSRVAWELLGRLANDSRVERLVAALS